MLKKKKTTNMKTTTNKGDLPDWQRVWQKTFNRGRKPQSRWDIFQGRELMARVGGEGSGSVYFSEFPNDSRAVDIFNTFKAHGDIFEVVIPLKRSKFGKRFGLARFNGVSDIRMLTLTLDNVFISNEKMYINVLRFDRKMVSVDETSYGTRIKDEASVSCGPPLRALSFFFGWIFRGGRGKARS